ncbi:APC family permease [Halobium salinum]|uniref:APC family permease n=1 Tax=Halobium salinum TaxID=1364940 RepID=A0ABD5P9V5_9EURY|nr:APC family permease [Halobium salinum]
MLGVGGESDGGGPGSVVVTAVAVGSLLGGGVLFVPKGVENLAGPVTPVAYLLAAVGAVAVAGGYALLAGSPLGARTGGSYLHVSRVWDSRSLGFLVGWAEVGGYVAVLGLVAAWVGELAAPALGPLLGVDPTGLALLALALVSVVHLHPRAAGAVTAGLVAVALLGLVAALVAAALDVVPRNFRPLFPTPAIGDDPLGAVGRAALAATAAFLGVDAAATLGGEAREARRTVPRSLVAGVAGVGVLLTLVATVTLGVIPWTRLVFARAPFAAAAGGSLGVGAAPLVGVGLPVAAFVGLVSLPWAPSRLLRGMGEVVPPLAHTNRFGAPDAALVVTVGTAGALVASDTLVYALYLVPVGPAVAYAVHALSVAALPAVRPRLYAVCDPRPPVAATVGLGLGGLLAAGGLAALALTLDPVSTLLYTTHRPAVPVVPESLLLVSPTRSVVPALLGWLTVGALAYVVAGDYRAERGVGTEPTAAAYRAPGENDGAAEADAPRTLDDGDGTTGTPDGSGEATGVRDGSEVSGASEAPEQG